LASTWLRKAGDVASRVEYDFVSATEILRNYREANPAAVGTSLERILTLYSNERSGDGWRLHTVAPRADGTLMLVFSLTTPQFG
jgi:hypothetical protein